MSKRSTLWLGLVLLVGCAGPAASSSSGGAGGTTTASDPYAGTPTVYDVVNDATPLPRESLLRIAAYLRRLEQDRAGVLAHDVATYPSAQMSPPAHLLAWITETQDVHLVVSPFLSAMSDGHGADVGALATMGSLFGMTAYVLEHPEAEPQGTAVQVAGIEYALRWYEQSVRAGEGHNTVFDDLLAARDRGELAAWFEAHVRIDTADAPVN